MEFIKPIYNEQRKILTRKLQEAMRLPEESTVIICQNPKCRRQIEEPIRLANISVTPAEQYDACPHCFTKLEPTATFSQEEEVTEESVPNPSGNAVLEKVNDFGPRLWERVKDLIARSDSQEEAEMEREEPQTKPFTGKEKEHLGCPQNFGYLAIRPRDVPIPQECLLCPKIVDCMLKVEEKTSRV